jgi:hypothetical protein
MPTFAVTEKFFKNKDVYVYVCMCVTTNLHAVSCSKDQKCCCGSASRVDEAIEIFYMDVVVGCERDVSVFGAPFHRYSV